MTTEILKVNAASLARAASLLQGGGLVAFPTETVYGLGADAMNGEAVRRIFLAKERPMDNPLIAHVADAAMLRPLVRAVDARARDAMDAFWPGPLTLVLPRTDRVPDAVSAGLSTVAVRMPAHEAALSLIRMAGTPIAAPSANRSGRPSPTAAAHVLKDLGGRIPLILDGGACPVGVESTVLDLSGDVPMVLRPGGVTIEMLREVLPDVAVDPAVLRPLAAGAEARSPGMRHRHYAPRAHVTLVAGAPEAVRAHIRRRYDACLAEGLRPWIMCNTESVAGYGARNAMPLGSDAAAMARDLFGALRALDERGAGVILAEAVDTSGLGLAWMNRMLRAADFDIEHV